MTHAQLEHLIRVAADITQDDDIVVIGSQALLAQFPDAPASLRVSVEADMYPRKHPDRADLRICPCWPRTFASLRNTRATCVSAGR